MINTTGCRGARLLVRLTLKDRVQPSFIAGVVGCRLLAVGWSLSLSLIGCWCGCYRLQATGGAGYTKIVTLRPSKIKA